MPLLSSFARRRKLAFFLPWIPKEAAVLEVGAGSGWLGDYLEANGWSNYTSLDREAPADISGDVNDWRSLGLQPNGFDVIIAFELVEHGDFYGAFEALLKPGGLLLVTTPVPRADWVLKWLEQFGLNQRRTSPHSHLHDLRKVGRFKCVRREIVAGLSQWAVFRKPAT
jgi:2-polyprenyl-3-methyl-5-hydroxy-6-metoxy-1,4-benzoquinol methylase